MSRIRILSSCFGCQGFYLIKNTVRKAFVSSAGREEYISTICHRRFIFNLKMMPRTQLTLCVDFNWYTCGKQIRLSLTFPVFPLIKCIFERVVFLIFIFVRAPFLSCSERSRKTNISRKVYPKLCLFCILY